MIWAIIITSFGCVLLFSNFSVPSHANQSYIAQKQLGGIIKIVGVSSIVLSAVFWSLLHGQATGLMLLIACALLNFVLIKVIKLKSHHVVGVAGLLIGLSFIFTTVSILTDVI